MQPSVAPLLQSHILLGGNGLPSLEISSIDPMDWIDQQVAARHEQVPDNPNISQQDRDSIAAKRKEGMDLLKKSRDKIGDIGTSIGDAADAVLHPVDAITGKIAQGARGVAILAAMLLLGVALVLLGAWQFTKE